MKTNYLINSKYRYGLNFSDFYDSMVELHDMNNIEVQDNGLRKYSASSQKTATALADNVQILARQ